MVLLAYCRRGDVADTAARGIRRAHELCYGVVVDDFNGSPRQSIKKYMNNYRANRVIGLSLDYVFDTRSECVKGGVSIISK